MKSVRLARPYGLKMYVVEEQVPARTIDRRSMAEDPGFRPGEIEYSTHAGRIIAVNGEPVRR